MRRGANKCWTPSRGIHSSSDWNWICAKPRICSKELTLFHPFPSFIKVLHPLPAHPLVVFTSSLAAAHSVDGDLGCYHGSAKGSRVPSGLVFSRCSGKVLSGGIAKQDFFGQCHLRNAELKMLHMFQRRRVKYDIREFFLKPSAIYTQHYASLYNNVLSGRSRKK